MKILLTATLLAISGWAATAVADPWKDESGKGRWGGGYERGEGGWRERGYGYYGGGHKEEFWLGGCKVERKWDGDEYKEERKCKRGWRP